MLLSDNKYELKKNGKKIYLMPLSQWPTKAEASKLMAVRKTIYMLFHLQSFIFYNLTIQGLG